MTQLTEQPPAGQQPAEPSLVIPRPHTDAAALRAIDRAKDELHDRIERIKADPRDHHPKLRTGCSRSWTTSPARNCRKDSGRSRTR
jgi:hypothetical protein